MDNVTLGEFTGRGPAIASFSGLLFLVWRGGPDDRINALSSSDGKSFAGKWEYTDSASGTTPALATAKRLHVGWISEGLVSAVHVATIRI